MLEQAKHLRSLELEHGMGAAELVGRMEQAGAHPLHHSVIVVKQRHLEDVCKGELDSETADRVLQWGADLVKYYRSLEPGVSRLQGRLLFCLAKARIHQLRHQGGPQVDGRREVLALQVRARRMIEGYTK